jgi:hypothetical protein
MGEVTHAHVAEVTKHEGRPVLNRKTPKPALQYVPVGHQRLVIGDGERGLDDQPAISAASPAARLVIAGTNQQPP